MADFRKRTPQRRQITRIVLRHTDHREDLIIDYENRCGYCGDIDSWRIAWYEIDHFVPKKYLKTISVTEYSNLVYACRSCNNAKRADWPTKDETQHHLNNEGFIDPCDVDYDRQFARKDNGRISPITQLGTYMYNKLKLYKPQHEIIWSIEQLDALIQECETILETVKDSALKEKLLNLYTDYRNYTKQLGGLS